MVEPQQQPVSDCAHSFVLLVSELKVSIDSSSPLKDKDGDQRLSLFSMCSIGMGKGLERVEGGRKNHHTRSRVPYGTQGVRALSIGRPNLLMDGVKMNPPNTLNWILRGIVRKIIISLQYVWSFLYDRCGCPLRHTWLVEWLFTMAPYDPPHAPSVARSPYGITVFAPAQSAKRTKSNR